MTRLRGNSVLLMLLLIAGCFPVRDYSSSNMSSLYRGNEKNFHPEFVCYNESDTTVRVFVKLLPSEFLFSRHPDDQFRATIKLNGDLLVSYEDTKLIDSSSATFNIDLADKSEVSILDFSVPAPPNNTYVIRCTITDMAKGYAEFFLIPVDRLRKPSHQDFLMSDVFGNPVFRNYLAPLDTVSIRFRDSTVKQFGCKYYKRDFQLAAPPFSFDSRSEFNYKPDSFFFVSDVQLQKIGLPATGFYHIQPDTSIKDGYTVFRFSPGFPDVTTPKQMIESARYLMNKKEFEELKSAENPKPVIDNFWLTHGGNEEKTRLLIKKYYGRVRDANKFFSSHTEGWRTDRGMIYVIFGSPGTVFRSNESESWIYGTPNSSLALNFFFIKVNNPFTENDFTLSRSPTYESSWYRAVEVWRQGRAYNSIY